MRTKIVVTIKLPLFKRWILNALIGGLLNNLEESRQFYKGYVEYSGKDSESGKDCNAQQRGIEQSINTTRLYCGMDERDFYCEEFIDKHKRSATKNKNNG